LFSESGRKFVIEAEDGSLLGVLMLGMVESRWPKSPCILTGERSEKGIVAVTNSATGKSLRIFTTVPSRSAVAQYLNGQECSLLTFDAGPDELQAALDALEEGPAYIAPGIVRSLATSPPVSPLTPREVEVARLVADGLSNSEIAEQLVISPHTVRAHLQSIGSRLNVNSRGKMAAKFRELQL